MFFYKYFYKCYALNKRKSHSNWEEKSFFPYIIVLRRVSNIPVTYLKNGQISGRTQVSISHLKSTFVNYTMSYILPSQLIIINFAFFLITGKLINISHTAKVKKGRESFVYFAVHSIFCALMFALTLMQKYIKYRTYKTF